MDNCVFCDVAHNKKEALIAEYDDFVMFHDISPSAPVHILLAPYEHIASVNDLEEKHKGLVADMIYAARDYAKKEKLEGYKLIFNVGEKGGQVVFHLHLHLMGWPVEGNAKNNY